MEGAAQEFTCAECGIHVVNVVDGIPCDGKRCLVCRFLDDWAHIGGEESAKRLRAILRREQDYIEDEIDTPLIVE